MSITSLGTDMPGTCAGMLISSEESFYLISCPEGTQRYCHEKSHHLTKTGKLKLVVIIDTAPASIMGFPSVYMGISDNTSSEKNHSLHILSPSIESSAFLENWWTSCKVAFRYHNVNVCFHHGSWSDEFVLFQFTLQNDLRLTFREKKGKFLLDEATKLCVNKKHFSLLKKGMPVMNDAIESEWVYPEQVLSAPISENRVSIITPGSIFCASSVIAFNPHLIIDFRTESNINTKIFDNFPSIELWTNDPRISQSVFLSSSLVHQSLNAFCPQNFPRNAKKINQSHKSKNIHGIKKYIIQPEIWYNVHETRKLRRGTHEGNEPSRNDVWNHAQGMILCDSPTSSNNTDDSDDICLYVLGSGCSSPSVFRNTTCNMLIDKHDKIIYIIDCGEGNLGQLSRMHESIEFFSQFSTLVIAITHGHADHHFGIWAFLYCITHQCPQFWITRTLQIILPNILRDYAVFMIEHVIKLKCFAPDYILTWIPLLGGTLTSTIQSVPAIHSVDSYSFIIDIRNKNFVFSGDTRPNIDLATIGNKAEFLLHEATFLDENFTDAREKLHSTISEALDIKVKMNCQKCLLTHFSQKYIKRTDELIAASQKETSVGCAIDLMRIYPLRDLPPIFQSKLLAEVINAARASVKHFKSIPC